MVPKGVPEKILSRENPLFQGVVTLGTVMYRIDLGILFLILFALHALVCVCVCVLILSVVFQYTANPLDMWTRSDMKRVFKCFTRVCV